MTPRRRSSKKRGWPANLYESRGYYSYRNPKTGEVFGLGRDMADAFNQAIEANLYLAGKLRKERLIDQIDGSAGRTVADWIAKYEEILRGRSLSPTTLKQYRSYSRKMASMLKPDTKLRDVTALMVSEGLDAIVHSGRASLAKQLKSFMNDSFAAASVKGWRDCNDNPVREIKSAPVEVKRARLTLEVFQQIYDRTPHTWLKNAMRLALVSGQSRSEIASAKRKDIKEGFWWLNRGKTGVKIRIPLALQLNCLGASLADVLKECQSTRILSPYLIHHGERYGKNAAGRKVRRDSLSIEFAATVKSLELDFGGKEPPTFHEIRGLAARLYKAQGNVHTQDLFGHSDDKMTALYEDPRGAEWITVGITV